ncbi:TPA: hypothetical protein ACXLB4_004496, partial [Pseudomonas aeruginosa]
ESVNYLFIAPEYLFTANKDIPSHFMTETQFELIRAQLVFLSLRFPNLIIIPGSAGWFKTRMRSAVKIFRKSLAQPQHERGPEASRDMNKYLERYQRFSDGQLSVFWSNPLVASLTGAALAMLLWPLLARCAGALFRRGRRSLRHAA